MVWFYCNKDNFIPIECVNSNIDKYVIRLSNNNKPIRNKEYNENELRFISKYVNNIPTVKYIKNLLLSLQEEYDSSFEVNNFVINNKDAWLDSNTRVKLFNLLNLEKASDNKITTIWFNDFFIDIDIDKAITLLTMIEKYAKQCYDNTQKHYEEISKLESIEDCLQYDITAGYPTILNIQIQ